MKPAFRNAFTTLFRSLNPNPIATLILLPLPTAATTSLTRSPAVTQPRSSLLRSYSSSSMAGGESHAPPSTSSLVPLDQQFEDFRQSLAESGSVRDRIRAVAAEIDSAARLMHAGLLLVHQSGPASEVLEKAKSQIGVLKELFSRLAEIVRECPGQYYRYHGDWRSETQTVVSLLAFMHWLETGSLLMHAEAEDKLGLNNSEFSLDIEDYLVGICFMANELPRYVVNQVTAGDYDCPRKVLKFLTDLHAAFRMLNLRNDFLRKKFDGMKYDLKRVEEVHYDVKIRGLAANGGAE
ncbi:hypothetical protein RJ640_007167, partial [Escallonia rubra]